MNKAVFVLKFLEKIYPEAQTELENWGTEFQFLICILLSAQTTDVQVNKVTKGLFLKYPDVESFALAKIEELERCVSSINFYKTKSRHIVETACILKNEFNAEVPKNVKDLIKLPGVGKKTANVFLNELFHSNQGIAVDTHVARVAQRLGFTKNNLPEKIALDLEYLFLQEDWYKVNTRFVLFGRYHCKAKKPLCETCEFKNICEYYPKKSC